MKRLFASPVTYAAWAALVIGSLLCGYVLDPYVFAIAALILGWASAAVALAGLAACVLVRQPASRRLAIVSLLLLTGVAIAAALAILRTFRWN